MEKERYTKAERRGREENSPEHTILTLMPFMQNIRLVLFYPFSLPTTCSCSRIFSCCKEWSFDVRVMDTQKKIRSGEATLRFFPAFFSLTAGTPPLCLGFWMHNQLRRYGGSSGFSFEAGSKCRGGQGVYRLDTTQGKSIKELFDRVANGHRLPDPSYRQVTRHAHSSSFNDLSVHVRLTRSTTPDRPSSEASFPPPSSWPSSPNRLSAVSPDRPPAVPPPSDDTAMTSDQHQSPYSNTRPSLGPPPGQEYVNVGPRDNSHRSSRSQYDYVPVVHRRPVDDDVQYVQVDPTTHSSSFAHTPQAAQSTEYVMVDIQKTDELHKALKTQAQDRSRPVTKY